MTLEAHDLDVALAGRQVLAGVNARFEPNTLTAIMGPNGAGKTTLIRALAIDVRPTGGDVTWDGESITRWSPGDLALLRSYLAQDAPTNIPFTVADIVEMARMPHRRVDSTDPLLDRQIVDAAMRAMELEELTKRTFGLLSGGERARTSLARVLAQQTPVILLDEPTASLDLGHQERILRTFRSEAEAGATVVAVLHDLNLAAAHADRILFIDEGSVVAQGPPEDVLTPTFLTALYEHPITVIPHPSRPTPLVVTGDPGAPDPTGA